MPPTRRKAARQHRFIRERPLPVNNANQEQTDQLPGPSGVPGTTTSQLATVALPSDAAALATAPVISAIVRQVIEQMRAEGLAIQNQRPPQAAVPSATVTSATVTSAAEQVTRNVESETNATEPQRRPTAVSTETPTPSPEMPLTFPQAGLSNISIGGTVDRAAQNLTGGNSARGFSSRSISRSLDVGIDEKIRQKIVEDQYVEFAHLIHQKTSSEQFDIKMQNNTLAIIPKTRSASLKTLDQWNSAFHIFVSIIVQSRPHEAASLMKYAHTIQTISKRAGDAAALYYDVEFRKWRQEAAQDLPWEQVHPELYLEAMTMGGSRKTNNGNTQHTGTSGSKICYSFQNRGYCNRPNCTFRHCCKQCGGNHSFRKCTKTSGQRKESSSGSTASNNQSGGPKANTRNQ